LFDRSLRLFSLVGSFKGWCNTDHGNIRVD
jgi:hypothetical protein